MQKDYEFDLFMETSAKTGFNVEDLFVKAAKLLYENYNKIKSKSKKTDEKLKLDSDYIKNANKKGCCSWTLQKIGLNEIYYILIYYNYINENIKYE